MTMGTFIAGEWRIVDRGEAIGAGADPNPLVLRKDPHLIAGAVALNRLAVWSEHDLGDGWVAAYRIASAQGRPVVAEIRIFPDRWARGDRPKGRWAGDYLDHPELPEGGLSATTLRRARFAEPFKVAMAALRQHRRSLPYVFGQGGPLADLEEKHPKSDRTRVEDLTLARLARTYVEVRHSIRAVAQRSGLSDSTVRGRILMARSRGLLASSGKRGVAGGQLTPRAEALLRPQQTPRRTRKGKRAR